MPMKVEDLSRRTGVARNTIRYYARIGLLRPERQTSNGYRLFDETDVRRLGFIVKAKWLGLSLSQIQEIFRTAEKGESPCALSRAFVARRVVEVRNSIEALSRMQSQLERALRTWEHVPDGPHNASSICPLIESVVPVDKEVLRTVSR
jgi:MerR family transcriptional regulator, Zn(II)-responsive regulator of zntA